METKGSVLAIGINVKIKRSDGKHEDFMHVRFKPNS